MKLTSGCTTRPYSSLAFAEACRHIAAAGYTDVALFRTAGVRSESSREEVLPAFGICYDPGNIIYYTRGKERPETHVSEVAPLVTTGIIKDCVLRDDIPDVMITPGEGLVGFDAVLSALVEGGFRGPLYVECVGGESLDEVDQNVRRTLVYIQGILSGLPD